MSGKKYSDASERLDRQKFYDPNEALGLVKELASANFDEAVRYKNTVCI
jgi:large subunit ribosomal protein L1